jgi:uncharacterized membrane protein
MNIEKRKLESYGLIVGIMLFLVVAMYYFGGSFTGYAVYEQSDQTEFDLGTYEDTEGGGSAVVLFGENLTDNYLTAGIVFIFLVFAFFIVRKILRHKLKAKIKRKKK